MKNKKTHFVWFFICFLFVFSVIYTWWHKKDSREIRLQEAQLTESLKNYPLTEVRIADDDHIRGNIDTAKVVVIEYSNTECPYCKSFHYKFSNQIYSSHSGEIVWIYRHFPLPIFSKSPKEAEALECATAQKGNEMFWEYLETIFKITPSNDGLDLALLPKIAGDLGLDIQEFSRCLDDERFAEKVSDQKFEGVKFGVRLTPSVIIWDKTTDEKVLISGANSRFAEVKAHIERMLSEK